MKKILAALLALIVLMFSFNGAWALSNGPGNSGIKEENNIKLFIQDGFIELDNTPINVNGRLLLPLRELLTKLGVQDDDKHIAWDNIVKKVTIVHSETTIVLELNNKIALVNGTGVEMDTPPIIYKDRLYIPLRFISQSLGKKVVYDNETNTVFIREQSEFDKNKVILDDIKKNAVAMNKVDIRISMKDGYEYSDMKILMDSENRKAMLSVCETVYETGSLRTTIRQGVMISDKSYTKNYLTGKWYYEDLENDELFEYFSNEKVMSFDDISCSVAEITYSPDTTIIKSQIPIVPILDKMGISEGETRITLTKDQSGYQVKSINLSKDNSDYLMNMSFNFDKNLDINVPDKKDLIDEELNQEELNQERPMDQIQKLRVALQVYVLETNDMHLKYLSPNKSVEEILNNLKTKITISDNKDKIASGDYGPYLNPSEGTSQYKVKITVHTKSGAIDINENSDNLLEFLED